MRRCTRLAFAVALLAPALAGVLVTPAGAAAKATKKPGTIEICKSGSNGMTGLKFKFTLNGGKPITVTAGGCSSAISTHAGSNTVAELIPKADQVQSIQVKPKARLIGKSLSAGTATASVPADSTASNETVVTYTNEPKGGTTGNLKVCKVAGDPSLVGDLFSFTENGGPSFSVAAGTGGGNCSSLTSWPVGTVVTVAEQATSGTQVQAITVSNNRGSNTDLVDGTVQATIGSGVTTVTFTNIPTPPPQTGYLEICKYAYDDDPFVSGYFDFTITAPGGYSNEQSVLTGQCSGPIQVPAGNVDVAEAPQPPFYAAEIDVTTGRQVSQNLINQTVEVTVPQGDSSNETLVNYYDATHTGQLKICKTLAANAGALEGDTFTFDVSSDALGSDNQSVSIVVGGAGSTACKFFYEALPLGATVSVTEEPTNNVQLTGVVVSPAANDNGSTSTQANLTISAGTTTATFTNQALGTLEVCKNADDPQTATQTFQFTVNGGSAISIAADKCSFPIQVPAGQATITELPSTNFHLDSIDVSPGARLVSQSGSTVVVSVPFGGVGNETVVTYNNGVNTGQLKVCKVSSEPSLQNTQFTFAWEYSVDGTDSNGQVILTPGQCSQLIGPIPVVDAEGNPIEVTVEEVGIPTVTVSEIDYAGNGSGFESTDGTDGEGGLATFDAGQGTNQVTFINIRTPIDNGGKKPH